MRTEPREKRNLNLVTGSPSFSRERFREQEEMYQTDMFPNRWTRVSLKAEDKTFVFENLLTHFHVDSFREAFKALDGTKAQGVDGISKSEYGKNLEASLLNLEQRIKRGTYRPQPKKEVLIPKANGKTRPICISCFEDKIVDWVISKILTRIYEPLFIRNSFGYRPNKSADGAIKACYNSLVKNKRKHVVEIDFSSFFR
jgi:retron-type reverse transcriptase